MNPFFPYWVAFKRLKTVLKQSKTVLKLCNTVLGGRGSEGGSLDIVAGAVLPRHAPARAGSAVGLRRFLSRTRARAAGATSDGVWGLSAAILGGRT